MRVDDRFVKCLLHQGFRRCSNPPQYCSFPVTVSADSSNRPFSAKNSKKNKKTTAFQRRFPTLFRAVLYAVLCPVLYPMLSTVHSAFSLNRLGGILRPDFSALFQSQKIGAGVYRHQERRYPLVKDIPSLVYRDFCLLVVYPVRPCGYPPRISAVKITA